MKIEKIKYFINGASTEDQDAIMALAVAVNKIIDSLPKTEAPQGDCTCTYKQTTPSNVFDGMKIIPNKDCPVHIPQGEKCKEFCGDTITSDGKCAKCTLPQETVDVDALGRELFELGYYYYTSKLGSKKEAEQENRKEEIIATLTKSLTHHD